MALTTDDVEAAIKPSPPKLEKEPLDTFDGKSLVIDFILVYKHDDDRELDNKRHTFQSNLLKAGLKIQEETSSNYETDRMSFVKLHAPTKVLSKQADILALKKSVKLLMKQPMKKKGKLPSFMKPKLSKDLPCLKASFREDISEVFLADGEQIDDLFSSGERSSIVWEILRKTSFGDKSNEMGINRLLNKGAYTAAYPLHDGPFLRPPVTENTCTVCITDRQQLYQEWASPGSWYKAQPKDLVRKYLGDEVGIYFVWLGFYTKMLIPASIVGLLCFIYGLSSTGTKHNIPSQEICNTSEGAPGSYIMCPGCLDGDCPYQLLGDSCLYSKLSYLFDNPATVAFAVFMSFWATMFLELWKRNQARLVSAWGLTETELDMETRPEFDAKLSNRVNKLTGKEEVSLPVWNKTVRFIGALSGIGVVIIAFIGIMVYRIAVAAAFYATGDEFLKDYSAVLTSATASVINLIIIIILGSCPRTQTEYDNSLTFKIFIFEFFNCYSYLMYVAFFKGQFFTYPGDDEMWNTFFGIPGDQCDPAGCVSELFIQLIVIMVGKQVFNNLMEIVFPWIMKRIKNISKEEEQDKKKMPWEQDFELVPIRIDAFNLIVQQRRPVPKRANSLGAWFGILQSITFLAVVFNAFLIAFTTEFIPRIVYVMMRSPNGKLDGYIDFSMSVADYNAASSEDIEYCYYRGYRYPPESANAYEPTSDYWNILAARLAFIVVFEHVVMGLTGMLAAMIPDLPWEVKERAYEEEKLLAEKAAHFRDVHQAKKQGKQH
ncbi:hypothetical protein B566_EDAN010483 [Ephemera danica]|nr:hypothetical protein B566_EDAN010483 [Ephemera danica]